MLVKDFMLDLLQLFFIVVGPISDKIFKFRILFEGHSQIGRLDILRGFTGLPEKTSIGNLFVSDDNVAFARNFYSIGFLLILIFLTFLANFSCRFYIGGVGCGIFLDHT